MRIRTRRGTPDAPIEVACRCLREGRRLALLAGRLPGRRGLLVPTSWLFWAGLAFPGLAGAGPAWCPPPDPVRPIPETVLRGLGVPAQDPGPVPGPAEVVRRVRGRVALDSGDPPSGEAGLVLGFLAAREDLWSFHGFVALQSLQTDGRGRFEARVPDPARWVWIGLGSPEDRVVAGRILDQGRPPLGLLGWEAPGERERWCATDDQGRFQIRLPAGRWTVTLFPAGGEDSRTVLDRWEIGIPHSGPLELRREHYPVELRLEGRGLAGLAEPWTLILLDAGQTVLDAWEGSRDRPVRLELPRGAYYAQALVAVRGSVQRILRPFQVRDRPVTVLLPLEDRDE